jgi:hypothetical protein
VQVEQNRLLRADKKLHQPENWSKTKANPHKFKPALAQVGQSNQADKMNKSAASTTLVTWSGGETRQIVCAKVPVGTSVEADMVIALLFFQVQSKERSLTIKDRSRFVDRSRVGPVEAEIRSRQEHRSNNHMGWITLSRRLPGPRVGRRTRTTANGTRCEPSRRQTGSGWKS